MAQFLQNKFINFNKDKLNLRNLHYNIIKINNCIAKMNTDEGIHEIARRLRESGPSVESKRWMAQQGISGLVNACRMSTIFKIGYTTVLRIIHYIVLN